MKWRALVVGPDVVAMTRDGRIHLLGLFSGEKVLWAILLLREALEIWQGQNYSPIHSHGDTTGIIYCLAGQIDVMRYGYLAWDADKVGHPDAYGWPRCAWISDTELQVHKVF